MNARQSLAALLWAAGCTVPFDVDLAAGDHAALHDADSSVVIPRVPDPPLQADLDVLPGDLRAVPVPGPAGLAEFVVDTEAAIQLGKALFWDMQVGSDGIQGCASCHFRAGADPRSVNQLTPGIKHVPTPDLTFKTGGPNFQLTEDFFPLTRLAIPGVRGALDPGTDNDDAVSSMGVHHLVPGEVDPDGFSINGVNTRRVEPRNTPSVFNAVFNHRNFWDGRAENIFNGVNHAGNRDPGARVVRADNPRRPTLARVELENSSLASQAVFPILSTFEMAAPGITTQDLARALLKQRRLFADLGRRVAKLRPLGRQQVHREDSVLGSLSNAPRPGLKVQSYDGLIQAAFHRRWWNASVLVQLNPDGSVQFVNRADNSASTEEYTVMQYNFALFFGLAVQLYEATLISDDTPWDRFRRQHPSATDPALNPWTNVHPDHISRRALFGAHLFNDRTRGATNLRCTNCHERAELTDNSVSRVAAANNGPVRNRDGNIIDKGFNNIGVRPTSDDLGVGTVDLFGPLSFSRRLFPGAPPAVFDGADVTKGFGVEGAFKIPSLRNVALTAPYFHNGDVATLRDVVLFYSRGGSVFPVLQTDGTLIEPLGVPALTADETDAVVAFMEALTDERVVQQRAPFDHPQLFVPNGHPGDENATVDADGDGRADDVFLEIPAVGRNGGPLPAGFLE